MPKMKTKSRACKCMYLTATGKIMRRKCGKGHFLHKKSAKRKLMLSHNVSVHSAEMYRTRKMLCV